MITEELESTMSNLHLIMNWVVPVILFVTACICIIIAKNHIYRVALQFSGIALFTIALAWAMPLSAGFIVESIFDFENEYDAFGKALDLVNNLTAIFFIFGHVLLAFAFYKFRSKSQNDV